MSYVIAAPEMMTSAASDLATIGSDVSAAHMAASAPTVGLLPAAADEVSAGVARLFSRYAEDFHGLASRAAAFQQQFVGHLHAGAGAYASAEAANTASLQPLKASAVGSASTSVLGGILQNYINNIIRILSGPPSQIGLALIGTVGTLLFGALVILTAPISIPILLYLFFWALSHL
jgi:hypothetical protein